MAKHKWQKLPNGEINTFAMSGGYCNGPVCVECGHSFCQHCRPEEWESECPGRQGFRIRLIKADWHHGYSLGIKWEEKALQFWFVFWVVSFDFSGLFPYCKEIEEDF